MSGKVIAVSNLKGGSGKSTICIAVASELALRGYRARIIDCDPNRDSKRWADGAAVPGLDAVAELDPDKMKARVAQAREAADVTMIDLPGEASNLITFAIVRADVVLVPVRRSAFDTVRCRRTIDVIRSTADNLDREIPFRVVCNGAGGLRNDKPSEDVIGWIEERGYQRLRTVLMARPAYERMVNELQPLRRLKTRSFGLLVELHDLVADIGEVLGVSLDAREAAHG
jgi:chromosome partitioning protein